MRFDLRDLLAGLAVAGLMLPEGVAYAGIAGLPAADALAAGIAGGLAYALIGRSRFAIVAPTSSSAAILAAALTALAGPGIERELMAGVMVAMVGAIFLAAAILRLGSLSAFISRPVLRGFAFGLALTIALRQLPKLLGLAGIAPGNVFAQAWEIARTLGTTRPLSAALGVGTLALLLILRRWSRLPATLLVLLASIALSAIFDLGAHGVVLAGTIRLQPPLLALPELTAGQWARAVQLAAPIALILFAESWGTIRTMALRHGDNVVAGRELAALGVANVAAALARGMPVGAGFSAGSAADAAGSVSRLTGAIAALALLVMALFGSALIALIPEPVLAAVVIAALAHALSPEPFVRLVRIDRDQWIAAAAAGGVLALGVLDGMLAAVALSLIALLRDFSKPKVCTLGRTGPDGHDFVDRANHPEAVAVAGIGIYRPNAPLFFANAETALAEVARRAAADRARVVVLSLEETSDLDSTAAEALGEFAKAQAQAGRSLVFARLHDAARAVLAATGLTQDADEGTFSVADAVDRATILLSKPAPARSA